MSDRLTAARSLLERPINADTECERYKLVRRESLTEQLRQARLRGNERRAARLERAIVVGEGGKAIERRILDATWRTTLGRHGVSYDR